MEREPVEITIEPTHVDILSYAGPDRSISAEAIKEAKKLKARRYRNRRLGDFLKELGLTEGRATGIPTIQKHLKLNGNSPATIETDDDRTYFLMTIPCREDMIGQNRIEVSNKEEDTTHLERLKTQLANKLANDDLQVYIVDSMDINLLVDGLVNLISQVYLQVWAKAMNEQSSMMADVAKLFLSLRANNLTSSELLKITNIESLYKLRRYILEPAISAGYIEMSNPKKPTSSKQRYLLTEVGRSLFGQ